MRGAVIRLKHPLRSPENSSSPSRSRPAPSMKFQLPLQYCTGDCPRTGFAFSFNAQGVSVNTFTVCDLRPNASLITHFAGYRLMNGSRTLKDFNFSDSSPISRENPPFYRATRFLRTYCAIRFPAWWDYSVCNGKDSSQAAYPGILRQFSVYTQKRE